MSVVPEGLRDGKIGRFPVWAIGVVLAGAIILFVVIRNRRRETAAEPTGLGDTPLDTVDGIPTSSFADQLSGNFPANVSLAPLPERPETNAQWLMLAFDYLVGLSKDPIMVQRALQDYLTGKSLSAEQYALISIATSNSALSLPPEGVNLPAVPPPPGTAPPPGTDPPPAASVPTHVSPKLNYDLYAWATELNAQYPGHSITFEKLFGLFNGDLSALNPGARKYMTWDDGPSGAGYKIPKFTKPGVPLIRIR